MVRGGVVRAPQQRYSRMLRLLTNNTTVSRSVMGCITMPRLNRVSDSRMIYSIRFFFAASNRVLCCRSRHVGFSRMRLHTKRSGAKPPPPLKPTRNAQPSGCAKTHNPYVVSRCLQPFSGWIVQCPTTPPPLATCVP